MDTAQVNRIVTRASDPNLIAGIFNYCDRCCHRCAFTQRCFSYLDAQDHGRDVNDPAASPSEMVQASLERALNMMRIFAEQHGIVLTTSPGEEHALVRKEASRRQQARADPLVVTAERYPRTALPIVEALLPVLRIQDHARVCASVERVGELAISIASKTYRAVAGTQEEDYDASELQSDVNGSAKIARLMIAESTSAWTDVMKAGQASSDGVPAQIVALLVELDTRLAERFPQAMSFVRPGFDEPKSPGDTRE